MSDTIKVRRANVILDIAADDKRRYMAEGFDVIDDNMRIIEKAMSNDVNELRIMVAELQKENASLKAELDKLKKKSTKKETVSE